MKRLFTILTCACVMLASCDNLMPIPGEDQNQSDGTDVENPEGGSNENSGDGGNGNDNGNDPELDFNNAPLPLDPNPIVPVEQKDKIENALRDVMNELPAEDHRDLVELARVICDFGEQHFDNDYDASDLERVWNDDLYSKIYKENKNGFGFTECFVRMSECKGTVTLYSTHAEYTQSDAIKVIAKNVDGQDWIFTIESTQWKKDVYIGTEENRSLYVDIPSEIKVKMTVGSKTYADITLNLKYNISSGGIDPKNDNIEVTTSIVIDDIGLTIQNTGYNAKTGDAALKATFKKGSKEILDINIAANAIVKYNNDYEPIGYNLKGASFKMDLMGDVLFVGNVTDAQELFDDFYNDRLELFGSKENVQKTAEALNQRANICISYNGGETAQAMIKADYFEDEGCSGEYYVAPVLVFSDESSYGFMEFFEEYIMNSLEDWENEIKNFIESYIALIE